jgi:hypothetical protein
MKKNILIGLFLSLLLTLSACAPEDDNDTTDHHSNGVSFWFSLFEVKISLSVKFLACFGALTPLL